MAHFCIPGRRCSALVCSTLLIFCSLRPSLAQDRSDLQLVETLTFGMDRIIGISVDEKAETIQRIYTQGSRRVVCYDARKNVIFKVMGAGRAPCLSKNGNYLVAWAMQHGRSKAEPDRVRLEFRDRNGKLLSSDKPANLYEDPYIQVFPSNAGYFLKERSSSLSLCTPPDTTENTLLEWEGPRGEEPVFSCDVSFTGDPHVFFIALSSDHESAMFLMNDRGDTLWRSPELPFKIFEPSVSPEGKNVCFQRWEYRPRMVHEDTAKPIGTYILERGSRSPRRLITTRTGMDCEFLGNRYLSLWSGDECIVYDLAGDTVALRVHAEMWCKFVAAGAFEGNMLVLLAAVNTEQKVIRTRGDRTMYSAYELHVLDPGTAKVISKTSLQTRPGSIEMERLRLTSWGNTLFLILPSTVMVFKARL